MNMIRLENISKTYKTRQGPVHAVKNTSLDIRQGEIFGIIGSSGAGKSTLVRCINLLERPDEGKVFLRGKELTALTARELREERKKIGMIFQHFNLFRSRTVAENIGYPLKHSGVSKEARKKRVSELLELVGLSDKAHAYPAQLSGGQKQRVGIARALANRPSVLLCDEATSALDPQTTESILELLAELNRKLALTVVIITHEMRVIKSVCHRAAVMDGGIAVETGTVFDIFSNPKSEITKNFIATTTSLHKIHKLIEENSPVIALRKGDVLARFSYIGRSAVEALISTASIRFNVKLNIIFGDLEIIDETPIGGLIVIMSGEEFNQLQATLWIVDSGVKVEVLKHG